MTTRVKWRLMPDDVETFLFDAHAVFAWLSSGGVEGFDPDKFEGLTLPTLGDELRAMYAHAESVRLAAYPDAEKN
jgi:hypothetical protein